MHSIATPSTRTLNRCQPYRRGLALFALLFTLLGTSYTHSADFQKGQKAFDQEDYVAALTEWTPLAEQGDAKALCKLGLMYEYGLGVTQNYKTAFEWYQRSADLGLGDGQFSLGRFYTNGLGVEKNLKTGISWYRLAANQGHAMAQNNLGFAYGFGRGVSKDLQEAKKWLELSAEQGNFYGQINLGYLYDAEIIPVDHQRAYKLYMQAIESGDAEAQYLVAETMKWAPKGGLGPYKLYTLAANQGHAKAQFRLWVSRKGRMEFDKGLKWLLLAVDQGLPEAQYDLGRLYEAFLDFPLDEESNPLLVKETKDQQLPVRDTITHLAKEQGYSGVLKLLRQAAAQKHAGSQARLGQLYADGKIVQQDVDTALYWLRLAAKQYYWPAQYELSWRYEKGQGVPQNYVQALMWDHILNKTKRGSISKYKKLTRHMTPAEIEEAKVLSNNWLAENQR